MNPNPMRDQWEPSGIKRSRMGVSNPSSVCFKIASEDWEYQQIHRLNYETFVEEIPQHASNPDRILIEV